MHLIRLLIWLTCVEISHGRPVDMLNTGHADLSSARCLSTRETSTPSHFRSGYPTLRLLYFISISISMKFTAVLDAVAFTESVTALAMPAAPVVSCCGWHCETCGVKDANNW